jgi:Pyridine nucleotide-disulphide oxidoreductase/Integrase core domain
VRVGERVIVGRRYLVCTGATPITPDLPGLADTPHLTYHNVFDLSNLPRSLIVVGGGPLGMELTQAFQRLGSSVTIVAPRLLPHDDPDAGAILKAVFEREGVRWLKGRAVEVRQHGGEICVSLDVGSEARGHALLIAAGRQPNVQGLGLDRAGVTHSPRGIPVDDRLRTNVSHIFAAGDVVGREQFSHIAGWQAFEATRNALLPSSLHEHSALSGASSRDGGGGLTLADRPQCPRGLSGVREPSMIICMTTAGRRQQRYDHRLRDLVRATGDVTVATNLGVPRSTARRWLGKPAKVVVSLDVTNVKTADLQQEVLELRRRVKKLTALLRLAAALLRSSRFTLPHERLPDGRDKIRILRAVDRARAFVPLRALLRFVRLSPSRFYAWRRLQHACTLDDQSSCPHTSPHRLTPPEVRAIKDMVTALEYRHVPTGTLAVLAQRLGKVWASPSTWYRLVRRFGWRRLRLRVHPAKPQIGVRTTRANEMWHIDTTVIRLLDGTRAYLHAVIDNFSRRILAWRVAETFAPVNSVAALVEAGRGATPSETTLQSCWRTPASRT